LTFVVATRRKREPPKTVFPARYGGQKHGESGQDPGESADHEHSPGLALSHGCGIESESGPLGEFADYRQIALEVLATTVPFDGITISIKLVKNEASRVHLVLPQIIT
jgi:hypothetical protein